MKDFLRMAVWLIAGLAMYTVSALVSNEHPAAQTVFYKLGHVTTLAWFGYWISRQAIGRLRGESAGSEYIARGILIAGVMIAGSLGL